jgi:hypothetical protein
MLVEQVFITGDQIVRIAGKSRGNERLVLRIARKDRMS